MRRSSLAPAAGILLVMLAACSHTSEGPLPITGTADRFTVRGQYAPIDLEEVHSLGLESGKLVVHGTVGSVTLDLPPSADPTKPDPHWLLTTENTAGGKWTVVFTNDDSLENVAIELPPADSEVHYGVLAGPGGQDVMLLAWGQKSHCYWGYVTIVPKPESRE